MIPTPPAPRARRAGQAPPGPSLPPRRVAPARAGRTPGAANGGSPSEELTEQALRRAAAAQPASSTPPAAGDLAIGRAGEGHVSDGVSLVEEFADPGAQDGAGAQVRVDPPWQGYSRMRAGEVTDRLVAEPEAVLSVLLLYERAHRGRRSVLDAAQRELSRRRPPGGKSTRRRA